MGRIWSKFTHPNFQKYLLAGILSTILSTLMLIAMVDYLGMWVGTANIIVVAAVFVLRYLLYDKMGMLKK